MLRDRSFSIRTELQALRGEPDRNLRMARLAGLHQAVRQDQDALARLVAAEGGVVAGQYWVVNGFAVHVPPAALPRLRAHPRVLSLHPVRGHEVSDAAPMGGATLPLLADSGSVTPPLLLPIGSSTDAVNHAVADAWQILSAAQLPSKGEGARLVVFDTGIDADVDGQGVPTLHPSFATAGGSRVEVHLQAQAVNSVTRHVDVNVCQSHPSAVPPFVGTAGPHGWRQARHAEIAGHGTNMAAISAGEACSLSGWSIAPGHAPEATIVDMACSVLESWTALGGWSFSDVSLLAAIQVLREYVIDVGGDASYLHVLNLSLSGEFDPDHPLCKAFDSLARQEDLLVVYNATNQGDTTRSAFGFWHGLAVGCVHARTPGTELLSFADRNSAFVPIMESSRGPLHDSVVRYFPDVCATGAGTGSWFGAPWNPPRRFRYPGEFGFGNSQAQESCLLQPGIDVLDLQALGSNVAPVRFNRGTSQAAAQVSGAALLYRAARPQATAEETRAAILCNTIGTYTAEDGQSANTEDSQHLFRNRNTFGVGYVRDDLLAQFATRNVALMPLAEVVTLSDLSPIVDVPYTVNPASRYTVVVCWRRYLDHATLEELELADVNLEILNGSAVIASSRTPANSYERLSFLSPAGGSGQVTIRVRLDSIPRGDQDLEVQLVARQMDPGVDPAGPVDAPVHAATGLTRSDFSAGSSCNAGVDRVDSLVVPLAYRNADAWGSAAFDRVWQPVPPFPAQWFEHRGYIGYDLHWGSLPTDGQAGVQVILSPGQAPSGPIHGIAFRAATPIMSSVDVTYDVRLGQGSFTPNGSMPAAQGGVVGGYGVLVRPPPIHWGLAQDLFSR